MKYFAKIKYLGTHFHGFQVQPGKRTVQGVLCESLEQALGFPCRVTGCSRTDAGVHANEFCITVECEGATVPPEKLPVAVSRFLPEDLSLFYAKECDLSFHPRYDCISKEYIYKIKNCRVYDPFEYGRVWFLPKPINDCDVQRMNECCILLVGKHDFAAFMAEGSDVTDSVRTVNYLNVEKTFDSIVIRICADGFLYNMVRIIVGTLIDVAYGRKNANDVLQALSLKSRSLCGMTAPAEGLYLNKVNY